MGLIRGIGKRMDGWLEGIIDIVFREVSESPFFFWNTILVRLGLD